MRDRDIEERHQKSIKLKADKGKHKSRPAKVDESAQVLFAKRKLNKERMTQKMRRIKGSS